MMTGRWRSPALALLVLLLTDGLVLTAMATVMNPPVRDLVDLGVFLFASGSLALAIGYTVPAFARRGAIRTVRGQIVLMPVLVVALTVVNLGFIGHLMFVSAHDLGLLTLVLLFALALALVLAFVLSDAMAS